MVLYNYKSLTLNRQRPSPVGEGGEAVYKLYSSKYFAAETDEVVYKINCIFSILLEVYLLILSGQDLGLNRWIAQHI